LCIDIAEKIVLESVKLGLIKPLEEVSNKSSGIFANEITNLFTHVLRDLCQKSTNITDKAQQ
jgi:hypothetical protein